MRNSLHELMAHIESVISESDLKSADVKALLWVILQLLRLLKAGGNRDDSMDEPLVDTDGAAEWFGVSPKTIYNLRTEGKLKYIRIGANIRFAKSDLDDFKQTNRVG